MKLRCAHIVFTLIILGFSARGQQDIQLSQQYLSRLNINPASTKVSDFADAYLFVRQQWVGVDGAPSTQMLNAHGYLDEIRSSVGMSFLNDIVGRNRFLNLTFSYAYHIKVGDEKHLSLGLSAGLVNRRFDGDIMTEEPEWDPEIIDMLMNGRGMYRPDVNLGLMYATPKFAFGASVTHFAQMFYDDDWLKVPLHAYAFLEYGIDFNNNVRFTPRVQLLSAVSSTDTVSFMDRMDMLFDLGGIVSWHQKFWIGGSFRSSLPFGGTSFAAMVGLNINSDFRIGYSYDHQLGNTFQNVRNYGSHEIMLNYRIRVRESEVHEQTPRFFE